MAGAGSGMRVAVTGANGFVGSAILEALASRGRPATAIVRREAFLPGCGRADAAVVADFTAVPALARAFTAADAVVHTAARTHHPDLTSPAALPLYMRENVEVTTAVVEAAAAAGVRRVVFLSSIKVNGERTLGTPFHAGDAPAPEDSYGKSKLAAERAAAAIAHERGLELVVVRSPLVYGAGVKGNLSRLISLIARGVPVPVATPPNRRSLIGVRNLADALVYAIDDPRAAGRTFLACDGPPVSTEMVVREIAAACGCRARMLRVPAGFALRIGRLLRQDALVGRLFGSLEVDPASGLQSLGWRPPVGFADEVRAMCAAAARGRSE